MAKKKMIDHQSTLEGAVSDALSEAQNLRDEMGEWADNMESNNMEHLPKYEEVSETRDALDGFVDNEPTIPAVFPKGLKDELTWQTHYKRRQSRADRLADALITIQIVIEHIDGFISEHDDNETAWEGTDREEWKGYVSELEDIQSEMESVSFPGMY